MYHEVARGKQEAQEEEAREPEDEKVKGLRPPSFGRNGGCKIRGTPI